MFRVRNSQRLYVHLSVQVDCESTAFCPLRGQSFFEHYSELVSKSWRCRSKEIFFQTKGHAFGVTFVEMGGDANCLSKRVRTIVPVATERFAQGWFDTDLAHLCKHWWDSVMHLQFFCETEKSIWWTSLSMRWLMHEIFVVSMSCDSFSTKKNLTECLKDFCDAQWLLLNGCAALLCWINLVGVKGNWQWFPMFFHWVVPWCRQIDNHLRRSKWWMFTVIWMDWWGILSDQGFHFCECCIMGGIPYALCSCKMMVIFGPFVTVTFSKILTFFKLSGLVLDSHVPMTRSKQSWTLWKHSISNCNNRSGGIMVQRPTSLATTVQPVGWQGIVPRNLSEHARTSSCHWQPSLVQGTSTNLRASKVPRVVSHHRSTTTKTQANSVSLFAIPISEAETTPFTARNMMVDVGTTDATMPASLTTEMSPALQQPNDVNAAISPGFSSPPPTPASGVQLPTSASQFSNITSPTKHTPRYRAATASSSAGHQSSKALASRGRDPRLPTSKTSSVFDRLYKTQTSASRSWAPVRSQARKVKIPTTNGSSPSKLLDEQLQVFDRLHITGTVANTSKRIPLHNPTTTPSPDLRTPKRKIGTPRSFGSGGSSPFSPKTPSRTRGGNLVYSPRMKPKTKLVFKSKHHAGNNVQDVPPISLGYSFFQKFCAYEVGDVDAKTVAKEVIQAFFRKDFPQGRYVVPFIWQDSNCFVNSVVQATLLTYACNAAVFANWTTYSLTQTLEIKWTNGEWVKRRSTKFRSQDGRWLQLLRN